MGNLPAIRWLESNGYDVSYITSVDADRSGSLITNHKTFCPLDMMNTGLEPNERMWKPLGLPALI